MVVTKGYIKTTGDSKSLINRLFGWREMYRLTLQNGIVTRRDDMGGLCRKVQMPAGENNDTPLSELIARDTAKRAESRWQNLYKDYEEYFSM